MQTREELVTRHADVVAVLSDQVFAVPAVPGEGRAGSLAWLRATVCRFSEGTAHRRRRGLVGRELAGMDPAALRRAAGEEAGRLPAGHPAELTAADVRAVPLAVLGRAFGVTDLDPLVAAVPVVAAGYLTGSSRPEAADEAVGVLVRLLGPGGEEEVAARIAVLAQACDATAALVHTALRQALRLADPRAWPGESLVTETLRFAPPVPVMRRVARRDATVAGKAVPAGTPVTLDVAAANRDPDVFADPHRFDPGRAETSHLTFGAGRRPCPGAGHAVPLAAAVVEAVLARL